MKSTAALALALGLAYGFLPGASFALGLEQKGQPQATVSSLPTYGLEVPTRTALKTVIPSGWQLFVHQSVKLPPAVSWKVDDTWPQVLGNMAASANLSVLVDWDSRTVLIRTLDVAVQEQATRAEIAQAATTPLPRFESQAKRDVPASEAAQLVRVAGAETFATNVATRLVAAPVAPTLLPPAAAPAVAPAPAAQTFVEAAPPAQASTHATAPASGPVRPASAGAPVLMPALLSPQLAPALSPIALVTASAPAPAVAPAPAPAPAVAPPAAPAPDVAVAASKPEPMGPRAATVLSAFATAAEPEVAIAAPPQSARPNFDAFNSVQPAPVRLTPLVQVVKSVPVKPVKVIVSRAPVVLLSQVMAQSRDNERTPDSTETPNADRLARQSALRNASGAPNPFNDVMPQLPFGVFASGPAITAGVASPTHVEAGVPDAAVFSSGMPPAPAKLAVIRTNPTPAMVATQESAAMRNPAQLASTANFKYTAATAWNKPSVRSVAQGIANKFGLRLVWAAPEVQLRGPVTMLANSAQEDLYLLKKALGPSSLEMTLDGANLALSVTSRDGSYISTTDIFTTREQAFGAGTRTASSRVSNVSTMSTSPASESAPAPHFVLIVEADEPLENAILRFSRAQGYTLEWKVPGGFEAARRMEFEGGTVAQVLAKVLPSLGVSADVYTHDKHIVVRPGEGQSK